MKTLFIYPETPEQVAALKAVIKALKIKFEVGEEVPAQSIADDIRESVREVKLHQAGKIKLQDGRDLMKEL